MFKFVTYLSVITLCWGCGDTSAVDDAPMAWEASTAAGTNLKGDTLSEDGRCVITMCLTGAMNHETPSNHHFRSLCADDRLEGLVQDCGPGGCRDTFDSFLQFPRLTVYPALIEALDGNKDGRISDEDPVCEVNLIGFSWGGVNVLSIADHLSKDQRVPETHKAVRRAVLLDAFQPLSQDRMYVPDNVDRVLSVRHSEAPRHDCSSRAPLGPYLGLAPICETSANCKDYDYSQAPFEAFTGSDGGLLLGRDIGHCDLPYVAHDAVIDFLQDRDFEHRMPTTP